MRTTRTSDVTQRNPVFEFFASIRQTITAEFIANPPFAGNPSPLPVFIVGMPRSGSTLVEQILASHPEVHAAGERGYFREAVGFLEAQTRTPFPDNVANVTPEQLRALGANYLERVMKLADAESALPVQRITDKLTEAIRDSQTEVLRAFYNWARPLEMRLRPMEELSQRLSWLEDRVAELERGRFPSAH